MIQLTPDAPQVARVLAHLEEAGSISQAEAHEVHGVRRLAARVLELREQGHDVRSELRNDEAGSRYARYFLYRNGRKVRARS